MLERRRPVSRVLIAAAVDGWWGDDDLEFLLTLATIYRKKKKKTHDDTYEGENFIQIVLSSYKDMTEKGDRAGYFC